MGNDIRSKPRDRTPQADTPRTSSNQAASLDHGSGASSISQEFKRASDLPRHGAFVEAEQSVVRESRSQSKPLRGEDLEVDCNEKDAKNHRTFKEKLQSLRLESGITFKVEGGEQKIRKTVIGPTTFYQLFALAISAIHVPNELEKTFLAFGALADDAHTSQCAWKMQGVEDLKARILTEIKEHPRPEISSQYASVEARLEELMVRMKTDE